MSPSPPDRHAAPAARVVRPADLTAAERAAWVDLHRTHAAFASPYFHPAFVELAAAARKEHAADDIRVAVLPGDDPDGPRAGFFPFQRGRFGRSGPPGGRLCDAHGVIRGATPAAPGTALLRACRLRAYDFHMLPAANPRPGRHVGRAAGRDAGEPRRRVRCVGRPAGGVRLEAAPQGRTVPPPDRPRPRRRDLHLARPRPGRLGQFDRVEAGTVRRDRVHGRAGGAVGPGPTRPLPRRGTR